MLKVIARVLFWTYQRGSWQYDLLCFAIILFIFLTPDHVFHQRDSAAASSMVKEVESIQVGTESEKTPEQESVSEPGPKGSTGANGGTAP
jgi:hypothetical protein